MTNQKKPWQVDVLERLPIGECVDALPWATHWTIVLVDPQGSLHDGEKVSIADLPPGTMEFVVTLSLGRGAGHSWKKTRVNPPRLEPVTEEQANAFVRALQAKTERDQKPKTISVKANERGFMSGDFQDLNGILCSIQKSSLATDNAIWLGVHPTPSEHEKRGYGPTRMHLNRQHVAALLPLLQHFVDTGELPQGETE